MYVIAGTGHFVTVHSIRRSLHKIILLIKVCNFIVNILLRVFTGVWW